MPYEKLINEKLIYDEPMYDQIFSDVQSTPLNRDTFVFGSLSRLSGVPD